MMPESLGFGEMAGIFRRPIAPMQALEMLYNSTPPGR
jgi:hypothetical protein